MNKVLPGRVLCLLVAGVVVFALAMPVLAQQNDRKPADNALVRLLESKGILTAQEAEMVSQASSAEEANQRLAKLLLAKGLISQEEYTQTVEASVEPAVAEGSANAKLVPAVLRTRDAAPPDPLSGPIASAQKKPAAPAVIPAIAPIRVLATDPPKREGLIPDIKIGPVRVKPYGFYKTSVIYDSSNPPGNDFPLPGFITDSGKNGSPEFHVKVRSLRIGSNFEWVDPAPNLTVTGRFEMDFEGNFTRATAVNISSIRNPQPRIRLAWGRVDYAATDKTTIFALFGQDWSLFASSTLPTLLETTGLGLGYGTLYTRQPMVRGGFTHNFGGSRSFKVTPEVAIAMPAIGDLPQNTLQVPALTCTVTAAGTCTTAVTNVVTAAGTGATGGNVGGTGVENQLAIGERQGADSARPDVQGRLALQWQLDKAPGVAPAQIIGSFFEGKRTATYPTQQIPRLPASVTVAGVVEPTTVFQSAFANGAQASYERAGVTGEIQLPTRWVTLVAKYYTGQDLRWWFNGQLLVSPFNDFQGVAAAGRATGFSLDGSSTATFGFNATNGAPLLVPQRPIRSQGGFVNLGFPLSRIFNADPAGRNAGWSAYLHWGIDEARARDVRRISATAGSRYRGDLWAATLYYKLNSWVTFSVEESLYRTRALPNASAGVLTTLFRGIPSRETHNFRSEIGTIFTF